MSITIEKILAASPITDRGRPTQLSADAKGERIAYASGKSIFVRSIDNPAISKQYIGHTTQTTVARFAPSGYYIASGDVSGSVRVWDAVEAVNTKGEYHIISGRINDIAWDGDSQRIIAVGDGRERFGHCITADSGNSVGEISGHSSIINSVSIRQQRPLRAATGSDDSSIVFLHGAPFKFATKVGDMHKGYVYGVTFSPDGSTLVSVGADKRIQLYDGKTGEALKQIGEGEHTGSIFGVSWSKDSKRFATASADQTVKIWDVESGKSVQTWKFGSAGKPSIPDQQVGIVWPAGRNDGLIISLNLAGDLNYLVEGSDKPIKIVQGHNRNITALALSHNLLWTGSFDGRICQWNISEGKGVAADLQAHTNQVIAFASASEHVYSVGWDDTLRSSGKEAVKLSAQPKGIASVGDNIYVASPDGIEIFSNSKPVLFFATSAPSLNSKLANTSLDGSATKQIKSSYQYTPTTIAASKAFLAVGSDANEVHIYRGGDHTFNAIEKLQNSNASISALAFSPSGDLLAAGNTSGKITIYNTSSWEVVTDRWSAHTSRVSSIAWNEAGTHAASGGLDTNIFVWSLAKPGSRVKAPNAHKDGVNGVCWVDGAIVSTGGDAAVKVWKVEKLT